MLIIYNVLLTWQLNKSGAGSGVYEFDSVVIGHDVFTKLYELPYTSSNVRRYQKYDEYAVVNYHHQRSIHCWAHIYQENINNMLFFLKHGVLSHAESLATLNNLGTWCLNGLRHLFHSFRYITQCTFKPMHVYKLSFITDKHSIFNYVHSKF